MPRHRSPALRFEALEGRLAPAILVSPSKLVYEDVDGDHVTVAFSKPILDTNNVDLVFGPGFVNGTLFRPQQLEQIDLAAIAAANGTTVAVTAVRSPNGGDGLAAVGHINAAGIDLGPVTIDGDLGRIVAGDDDMATSGLKGLTVQSLGRNGTATGAPDLASSIRGRLDFLMVKSDVRKARIETVGGTNGRIGRVFVGGSLIGGNDDFSGSILSSGDMGPVTIRGDIVGGENVSSGKVSSAGRLAGAVVGGSVRGGNDPDAGEIESDGDMGPVNIRGDLLGGTGDRSGSVHCEGRLARVTVGRSVRGGGGDSSGTITSTGDMGVVTIGGDLAGGGFNSGEVRIGGRLAGAVVGGSLLGGFDGGGSIHSESDMGPITVRGELVGTDFGSGTIIAEGRLSRVTVGGSVVGGFGDFSGGIFADGDAGLVTIGGDLKGGSAHGDVDLYDTGIVRARRCAGLTLHGSLIAGTNDTTGLFKDNGVIRVENDLGPVLIKGSVIGNPNNPAIISARGQVVPTATTDVAIASLRVLGRVEFALILAGVDTDANARNADAQIGPVSVGGDWVASSLAAGAVLGGGLHGGLGTKMSGPGVKDQPGLFSRIASLTIGGQALGTPGRGDYYGVVAEAVAAMTIAGTPLPMNPGIGNDDFFVGISDDFRVTEI